MDQQSKQKAKRLAVRVLLLAAVIVLVVFEIGHIAGLDRRAPVTVTMIVVLIVILLLILLLWRLLRPSKGKHTRK